MRSSTFPLVANSFSIFGNGGAIDLRDSVFVIDGSGGDLVVLFVERFWGIGGFLAIFKVGITYELVNGRGYKDIRGYSTC